MRLSKQGKEEYIKELDANQMWVTFYIDEKNTVVELGFKL